MENSNKIVEELHRKHILKTEEWLRLRIRPKPRGWPESFWKRILNKLIYLERSGIKFDSSSSAD
jgi:hypothetical protein